MSTAPIPPDAAARIAAHDGSLFGGDSDAAARAAAFMGWTHLAQNAADILPQIETLALTARAEGLTDVVLLGMGGSSLAALVMGEVLGAGDVRLHVLDTTAPITVAHVLRDTDPSTTVYLVSSKSGGTIEPNTLYSIFRDRTDAVLGRGAAGKRFVAITDPGSTLSELAVTEGMRACILTPPDVGGRYSALTAFGLVPAALLGIDVRRLIRSALAEETRFTTGDGDTSLAEFIAGAHARSIDKLTLIAPPGLRVFGIWVEQLVAESLGKQGLGVIPVVDLGAPRRMGPDQALVILSSTSPEAGDCVPGGLPAMTLALADPYDLGGWFVLWEYSVALVGSAMGIDPFDQPNVAQAKEATAAVLAGTLDPPADLTVRGDGITPALSSLVATVRRGDYLALLAYVPEGAPFDELAEMTPAIGVGLDVSVCLELGPRYLHSTGQLHKGGPDTGVFLVITTEDPADIAVPGRAWGLRDLYRAQAAGDVATLASAGRRVLHVELPDASAGSVRAFAALLAQVVEVHQREAE